MPEISRFYGLIIRMFYFDHNPPHFHVIYQDFEAIININTLEIMDGRLPIRAKALALEWASEHRVDLLNNWERAKNQKELQKIKPLD